MALTSPLMNVMIAAARKAGKAIVRDFGEVENLQISRKGPADFVTKVDLKAERVIRDELMRTRPHYSFVMEESGVIEGPDKTHRWYIDPLDGTTNFLHGLPHFAVSIALELKGRWSPGSSSIRSRTSCSRPKRVAGRGSTTGGCACRRGAT